MPFSFLPRDLIKKFLVIDRARRLGNMKVSGPDFPSPLRLPPLRHSLLLTSDIFTKTETELQERTPPEPSMFPISVDWGGSSCLRVQDTSSCAAGLERERLGLFQTLLLTRSKTNWGCDLSLSQKALKDMVFLGLRQKRFVELIYKHILGKILCFQKTRLNSRTSWKTRTKTRVSKNWTMYYTKSKTRIKPRTKTKSGLTQD